MMKHLVLIASLILLTVPSESNADSTALSFVKVSGDRARRLANCPLFEGVTSILVKKSGKVLSVLPATLNRGALRVPVRYGYFACDTSNPIETVLRVKKNKKSEAVILSVEETDFPTKAGLSKAVGGTAPSATLLQAKCRSLQNVPGSFIYKTIGSKHFNDVRRNTIGLVVKPGVRAAWPGCIDVLDLAGNKVSGMHLYARGERAWSARYYAGVGCARSYPFNGGSVAARARKRGGSDKVYLDFGNTCFGPFEADQCIGSQQC